MSTKAGEHVFFALRFQQRTGPVMAKSVEDTAFYRYHRLVCLNEVGGSPAHFGTSVESFHAQNAERARTWPRAMISTSTHDTKRGEDTAARIAVLSEMPDVWARTVRRWIKLAEPAKSIVDQAPAPNAGTVYLLFQTIVGALPYGWDGKSDVQELIARLSAYLLKASKEAKQQTSWTNPNAAYDDAVQSFVKKLVESPAFLESARAFCQTIEPYGATNGIAQTLLRLCAPGVPDTYQGSELWNQSLVDPDNRGPSTTSSARSCSPRFAQGCPIASSSRASCSAPIRAARSSCTSRTRPCSSVRRAETCSCVVTTRARGSDHLVAFTRNYADQRLICCVPRLSYALTRGDQSFRWGRCGAT